jgi:hypothetical protein
VNARPEILWCPNHRRKKVNGWAYPPAVGRLLQTLTHGKRTVQLFGGRSSWGVRLDLDRRTRPHVEGDAWLPPFVKDAFDVAILDPPYIHLNQQMKTALLRAAAYVARDQVIWFHTIWIAGDALRLERSWLVRVGDSCAVRCLQIFRVPANKPKPRLVFTRGPALRYNRWLDGQMRMPFAPE